MGLAFVSKNTDILPVRLYGENDMRKRGWHGILSGIVEVGLDTKEPLFTKISETTSRFIQAVQAGLGNPYDLKIVTGWSEKITLVYLSSIVNELEHLDDLRRVSKALPDSDHAGWRTLLAYLPGKGRRRCDGMEQVWQDLTAGRVVFHLGGSHYAYSFDAYAAVKRVPVDAQTERSIRAPRISFVEDLNDNLSMIRAGVKNTHLRADRFIIGRKTQTDLALVYLEDLAPLPLIEEINRRLSRLSIDGLIDSGYLEQLISDNPWSIFPLTQSTERPDKTQAAILEGRAVLISQGSPQALIVPATLNELYQSPEDYYFGVWFGSFLRFFRILGNNIAVALPGLYVALIGVNNSLLPLQFTLSVAGSRLGVAIPLAAEILLMEIVVEVFREASLRLPSSVSQTLGVTAGIVLSTTAVQAGIVSSATLFVVVITAIASYSGPSFGIGFSWRILKFLLIIAAMIFGLFGMTIVGLVILAHAAMQNSFGVPFLSPWAPVRFKALVDTVTRRPLGLKERLSVYPSRERRRFRRRRKTDDEV